MARPKAYDEEALIERAMETFWTHGYEQTSVEQIVAATGVHRGSLYTAYPDKRALFLAGIRRYLDSVVDENIRKLREVNPAGVAVRQFFMRLIEAPPARLRRGCLLINTAAQMGQRDQEVAALIRAALRRVERALCARLTEAQEAHELRADADPQALARLLMAVLQGIRVMSRVGIDRATMRDAIITALAAIPTKPGKDAKGGLQGSRKNGRIMRAGARH